jgi:hypothetical protein
MATVLKTTAINATGRSDDLRRINGAVSPPPPQFIVWKATEWNEKNGGKCRNSIKTKKNFTEETFIKVSTLGLSKGI